MTLRVRRETIRDHGVVGGEALRVLLQAGAVERPAIDDQDLCWLEHSAERRRLKRQAAVVSSYDNAQGHLIASTKSDSPSRVSRSTISGYSLWVCRN